MSLQTLTALSTACIVGSGLSLLVGWYLIRWRRDRIAHRNAMLTATALAALFLVFYVSRWAIFGTKLYAGTGAWRALYFGVLAPHIVLAIAVAPLALRMIQLAMLRQDFARHRRLGRVTVPIWLFVAASGWMIYYLLYVKTY
jgi:putative membrane protein